MTNEKLKVRRLSTAAAATCNLRDNAPVRHQRIARGVSGFENRQVHTISLCLY